MKSTIIFAFITLSALAVSATVLEKVLETMHILYMEAG
jgi:hypothetical protein